MQSTSLKTCPAVVFLLALSACGSGGSEGIASIPAAPAAPPPLTPPPPPPPSGALAVPVQSTHPAVIEALAGGPKIGDAGSGNDRFPVTQTAVDPNFNGDVAETGRAKEFFPDFIGDGPFMSYSGGGWNLGASPNSLNLDWTRFGYWDPFRYSGLPHFNRGAWLAGYQTPLGSIPLSGSANYAGKVSGLYGETHLCQCTSVATIDGNVSVSADFSGRSLTGSMTGLTVTSTSQASGTMNDISFAAAFSAARNQFTGTTSVGSAGAGPWALSSSAAGSLTGHFYGPEAQELGAVWTLSDGIRRVIGSFGARKQ